LEYVLLVLYVAGLALVYHGQRKAEQRIKELEEELRNRDEHQTLMSRIDELDQLVRQMDPEPTRAELVRLRSNLTQMLESPPVPEPLPVTNDGISRPASVRQLIDRHMRSMGCEQIHILAEDAELDAEDLEVRVEAVKEGMCMKGRLHVVANDVREIGFDDTHKLFP